MDLDKAMEVNGAYRMHYLLLNTSDSRYWPIWLQVHLSTIIGDDDDDDDDNNNDDDDEVVFNKHHY